MVDLTVAHFLLRLYHLCTPSGEVIVGTQVSERRASPPYLPFKTFLNFIDMLAETVVPHRIDRSLMSKYPGSVKAQLRSALGWIGAIDEQGIVLPGFKELVKARGTDTWRDVFGVHFFNWYRELLGDLDLDTATLSQLKDRMRIAGAEGSVIIKATRFFLAGLDEAGLTYSPHFKVRGALTEGMARPKKAKPVRARTTTDNGDTGDEVSEPITQPGFKRLPLPLISGTATLILPEKITVADWDMLSAYVRMYFGFDKPEK
jgi:hypothetical protein